MSKNINLWQRMYFSYQSGKSRMDSYRAGHQVFEFITMFDIPEFVVIQQDGEWQNARIEIAYKGNGDLPIEAIEAGWLAHLEEWKEKH
jgi:hypothetical protein